MKNTTTLAFILTSAAAGVAAAQITGLTDLRSANISLTLADNDPQAPNNTAMTWTYDDPRQILDESLFLELRSPVTGFVSGEMGLTSHATSSFIRSSADITASVDVGLATPFVNAAFNNTFRFVLEQTTEFELNASFMAQGVNSGSSLRIQNLGGADPVGLLELISLNQSSAYSQNITLGPGVYEFSVSTWASSFDLLANDTEIATSAHTVDFAVVPAPGAMALTLLGLGAGARRRR